MLNPLKHRTPQSGTKPGRSLKSWLVERYLAPLVHDVVFRRVHYWGDPARAEIAPTAQLTNTLLNTMSGKIVVGEYTFTGHNVSLITGTHDHAKQLAERMQAVPESGRDITIGRGVWIGSNAVILGPCTIGDHAVIGAGAIVLPGTHIPPNAVAAGVPARVVRTLGEEKQQNADNVS
jgi:acetyltransferase-like isoleucine patch superfamily enzyme